MMIFAYLFGMVVVFTFFIDGPSWRGFMDYVFPWLVVVVSTGGLLVSWYWS